MSIPTPHPNPTVARGEQLRALRRELAAETDETARAMLQWEIDRLAADATIRDNTRHHYRDAHVRALTDELLRRFHDEAECAGEEEFAALAKAAQEGDENARREVADLCAGIDGWGGGLGWTDDGKHPCAVAYEAGLRADHAEREDTDR